MGNGAVGGEGSSAKESKAALRKQQRRQLKTLDSTEKKQAAAALCARIRGQLLWKAAQSICAFIPLPTEPDLLPLLILALMQRKQVFIPLPDKIPLYFTAYRQHSLLKKYLRHGYSTRMPVPINSYFASSRIDSRHLSYGRTALSYINFPLLMLIPGLAFTRSGARLGRGSGFYDRLCSRAGTMVWKVGVGFAAQMQASIPMEQHDSSMRYLLNECEFVKTGSCI